MEDVLIPGREGLEDFKAFSNPGQLSLLTSFSMALLEDTTALIRLLPEVGPGHPGSVCTVTSA